MVEVAKDIGKRVSTKASAAATKAALFNDDTEADLADMVLEVLADSRFLQQITETLLRE